MQIKMGSEVLADTVKRLVAATEINVPVPKNRALKLETYANAVRLTAYSGIFDAEATVGAACDQSVTAAVTKDLFSDIVLALPAGELKMTLDDRQLTLRCGASVFKIGLLADVHALPPLNYGEAKADAWAPLAVGAFAGQMEKVLHCQAAKPTLAFHNAIWVDHEFVCCTDGLRMAICPSGVNLGGPVVFQADTVRRLDKLFGGAEAGGSFFRDRDNLFFTSGGLWASPRSSAAKYPDFRQVLPRGAAKAGTAARKDLIAVLRRVMLVVRDGPTSPVSFQFSSGALRVEGTSETGDSGAEVVPCAGELDGRFRSNGQFLVDALASLSQPEARIEYRGPDTPLIITDGELVNVIMPITG